MHPRRRTEPGGLWPAVQITTNRVKDATGKVVQDTLFKLTREK